MSKILGIDLGAPNSYRAAIEGGEPLAPENSEGKRTASSVVTDAQFLVLYAPATRTLVCLPAEANTAYSLQAFSKLTGVHPAMLGYYCRLGLIDCVGEDPVLGLVFGRNALDEIRRIEHYRRDLGVRRKALRLICELWREGERLHLDLDFLRAP